MTISELKKEYETQDNRATAFPIYVTVQEKHCVGVMSPGYSVNCPHGDGETKTIYKLPLMEGEFSSKEELALAHREETGEVVDYDDIEELTCGYIWIDIEFFFTIKGAKEYIKSDAHNHGELRTYVKHFNQYNSEMRGLLSDLLQR